MAGASDAGPLDRRGLVLAACLLELTLAVKRASVAGPSRGPNQDEEPAVMKPKTGSDCGDLGPPDEMDEVFGYTSVAANHGTGSLGRGPSGILLGPHTQVLALSDSMLTQDAESEH